MKRLVFVLLTISLISCIEENSQNSLTKEFLKKQLDFSVKQTKLMAENCPDSLFPKSYENGELITSDSRWWCSGFYPGVLVYLYEYSTDKEIEAEIYNKFEYLEKEKFNPQNHDIGFKLHCRFGTLLRVPGDTAKYAPILLDASKTLLTRYTPELGVIRSWDSWNKAWQYAVIIDNMMNLELLLVSTELSGDQSFYDVAVSHADKTIENHFREDNSSWHVVSYDTLTGKPHAKHTHQGKSHESAWTKGQA